MFGRLLQGDRKAPLLPPSHQTGVLSGKKLMEPSCPYLCMLHILFSGSALRLLVVFQFTTRKQIVNPLTEISFFFVKFHQEILNKFRFVLAK